MKCLISVPLEVALDVAEVVAAIFRMPVGFGEECAITLVQPVEAGDAVDKDDGEICQGLDAFDVNVCVVEFALHAEAIAMLFTIDDTFGFFKVDGILG